MFSNLLKKVIHKSGYKLIKEDFFNKYYRHVNDQKYKISGAFTPLDQLFHIYLKDDFTFIQIGANNGRRDDPINHLLVQNQECVSGIAIEPVQEYFNDLQITYKDFPKIKLLRCAIHLSETEMTIYKIDPALKEVEDYLRGMASFDKANFTKNGVLNENILTEKVPCISLMKLIEDENIYKLHLLQIDAEGYDLEIIKSIDFGRIKPQIINFEHRWQFGLTDDHAMLSIIKLLMKNKYQIIINENDAIAYL